MSLINEKIIAESAGARWLEELAQMREARSFIVALGTVRFGPITPENESRIKAIEDLARLEALGIRLLTVQTWDELLADQDQGSSPPSA
jgi:hypothetical protein